MGFVEVNRHGFGLRERCTNKHYFSWHSISNKRGPVYWVAQAKTLVVQSFWRKRLAILASNSPNDYTVRRSWQGYAPYQTGWWETKAGSTVATTLQRTYWTGLRILSGWNSVKFWKQNKQVSSVWRACFLQKVIRNLPVLVYVFCNPMEPRMSGHQFLHGTWGNIAFRICRIIEDALIQKWQQHLEEKHAWMARVLFNCEDAAARQMFQRNDYDHFTDLLFMSKSAAGESLASAIQGAEWIPYDEE